MGLTVLRAARLDRITDAAEGIFLAQGYRGATMEGIAHAAGISKVTLYGYFRDKEQAFDAVLARFLDRLKDATWQALGTSGTVRERVTRALLAKHGMVADVVRVSAFAAELLTVRQGASGRVAQLDDELIDAIAIVTSELGIARILFLCAQALANAASSRTEMEKNVTRVVAALLPG
jgi:AcrR family transcriptional regulator